MRYDCDCESCLSPSGRLCSGQRGSHQRTVEDDGGSSNSWAAPGFVLLLCVAGALLKVKRVRDFINVTKRASGSVKHAPF